MPEITAILRPDLKKANAALATSIKDPVGHWYEAQLIHYGLPPSKDKARAKMRLLEALNASKLVVPAHITALETSLRKEYEAAERRAKAEYKKAGLLAAGVKSESEKKRKERADVTTVSVNPVNVNINFGNYGSVPPFGSGYQAANLTPQEEEGSAPKRAKTAPATTPRSKAVSNPTKCVSKVKINQGQGRWFS